MRCIAGRGRGLVVLSALWLAVLCLGVLPSPLWAAQLGLGGDVQYSEPSVSRDSDGAKATFERDQRKGYTLKLMLDPKYITAATGRGGDRLAVSLFIDYFTFRSTRQAQDAANGVNYANLGTSVEGHAATLSAALAMGNREPNAKTWSEYGVGPSIGLLDMTGSAVLNDASGTQVNVDLHHITGRGAVAYYNYGVGDLVGSVEIVVIKASRDGLTVTLTRYSAVGMYLF